MGLKKKLLGMAGVALCSTLVLGACGNSSDEGTGEKKRLLSIMTANFQSSKKAKS